MRERGGAPSLIVIIREGSRLYKKAGVMLIDLLRTVTLYRLLHLIDQDLATAQKQQRCPHCSGPLHDAHYMRKPRGGPAKLPDEYSVRLSLCCGREGCRRRCLPPSCLFMGRRVYWSSVVLIVVTLRQQRTCGFSARKVKKLFGITHQTLLRWMAYFRDEFPRSRDWRSIRGWVSAQVVNDALPSSLIVHFMSSHENPQAGLIACLLFLAVGQSEHTRRGLSEPTQKMSYSHRA